MVTQARPSWCRLALVLASILPCTAAGGAEPGGVADPLAWPTATRESRPWTRWWWLGSAVDRPNLSRLLKQYRAAGLGGVEICPIYGARGAEGRFIDFLSPRWMEMLAHTTAEAKRLGLGVDLTTGTGWPFGGPGVSAETASSKVVLKGYDVAGGTRLEDKLPPGKLQCLRAISRDGQQVDLTSRVRDGRLDWEAPPGMWRLFAVVQAGPVQKVKRAAPGGAGNVLDPYSVAALDAYLAGFDRAFAGYRGEPPRAHFHDSFEYYGASWTDDLFEEFRKRRGYDLRDHLPALFGEGPPDTVARVKCDYRETIADLHTAYIASWSAWAHSHNGVSRDQAHGAPANLLDLYAEADIPETEIFRRPDEGQVPFLKLASSAAHARGRALASSESFTWLGEHFQVPLGEVKTATDLLFLSGINHILFHGIPYSPEDVPWPGWLFYASVHFGPNGGLWPVLPAFNAYATRCQTILQEGRPANDVLLYLPVYDLWQKPEGLLLPFTAHNNWMQGHPFYDAARMLWDRGYGYDEVSDRMLADARFEEGAVRLGGNPYRAVVLPRTRLLPPATLRSLLGLAKDGATILIQTPLPDDVPGFRDVEGRRDTLRGMLGGLVLRDEPGSKVRRAELGRGAVLVGDDLDEMLRRAGVPRETMADEGLRFVRLTHGGGYHYFLANRGNRPLDGWVALATPATAVAILDPRSADRAGMASLRRAADGLARVYLQLQPGESLVLRTFAQGVPDARPWRYERVVGEPRPVSGTWRVSFVEGGPTLPAGFEAKDLASWTVLGDAEARRFAGTARYAIEFDRPAGDAEDWLLDLGRVCEAARVRLNGRDVATLWCEPFRARVGEDLRPGRNLLEVDVTNLAANRIADLDRRGVNWKSFHEINFVNIDYKPFDASSWPPRDSGLLGPVRLIPLGPSTGAGEPGP